MADGDGTVGAARREARTLIRLTETQLACFHRGEEEIFRRIVDHFSPRLLAFVRPFAVDSDDAHDLLQDTWQRVYEKRRQYLGSGTLLGWLYAVCRNVCLGARRKRPARDGVFFNDDDPADEWIPTLLNPILAGLTALFGIGLAAQAAPVEFGPSVFGASALAAGATLAWNLLTRRRDRPAGLPA